MESLLFKTIGEIREMSNANRMRLVKQDTVPVKESPFASRAGYLAIKLGEVVMRRIEAALAPLGLTPREYNVMTCISIGQDLSQQDLSRTLGLYAPGLVGLIDELQDKKLVSRKRSESDRRRYVLSVTKAAKQLLARADLVVSELDDELFGCMSIQENTKFRTLLRRVLAAKESNALRSGRK